MKVLWVSIRIFSDNEEKETGVWLKALAKRLVQVPNFKLANVSFMNGVDNIVRCDFGNIIQWAFPVDKIDKYGYPSNLTKQRFRRIISEFKPDIIQVWGSENRFKLLPFSAELEGIKVLTIQGVLNSIAPNLLLGLSFWEKLSTIGIRELLTCQSIFTLKKTFLREGKIENEMIKRSDFIITQSDWTDSQIRFINPKAQFYRTHRQLREEFLNAEKWDCFPHEKHIVYSAAVGYPLKGLHVLLRAMGLVKEHFPDVQLRLVGATGRKDFLASGYLKFIFQLIAKYKLERNVIWLGSLTAKQIVSNLQEASVFVNPSFVESYSLAFAEAMSIGTPSVISFAGAMPELAQNNQEALFYTPTDYKQCAYLITRLLLDTKLCYELSYKAVQKSILRNEEFDIIREQMNIYAHIIKAETPSINNK